MDASERKSEVRAEGAETPPASEPAAATPAASTPAASPSPRRRRARAHRHRWWRGPLRTIAGFVILGALIVFAVLAFTGRPLPAPHWLADQIEARVNRALQGGLQVKIGGIESVQTFQKDEVDKIEKDSSTPTPGKTPEAAAQPTGKPDAAKMAAEKAAAQAKRIDSGTNRVAILNFGPPSSWDAV